MSKSQSPPNFIDLTIATVAIALLGGFTEVLVQLARREVFHTFAWMSLEQVWMAPLASCLLALPLLGLLLFVRLKLPRLANWEFAVGAVAALAFLSVQFIAIHNKLHWLTQVLLAVGLGRLAGSYAGRHPDFTRIQTRRLALGLTVALAVLAVGRPVVRGMEERKAIASLKKTSPTPPNVLLIVLDTVRAASLHLYGNFLRTSDNLDRLANRGVVFGSAYSTASWTLPSHASLFTGRWPHELSADWDTPLDGAAPTLAEVLTKQGYQTGGFVANLLYTSRESGLSRGFIDYQGYDVSLRQIELSTGTGQLLKELRGSHSAKWVNVRKSAEDVTSQFLTWLDASQRPPFFAFLNYFDAHEPVIVPKKWSDRFKGPNGTTNEDEAEYEESIAGLDEHLGVLFAGLEQRGLLNDTIVIVTSDHGELVGEHGLYSHGDSLYREELEVPLLMFGPGIPKGRRIAQPVTLRDIPATIAELTGAPATLPGISLAATWKEDGAPTSPILASITRPRKYSKKTPLLLGNMVSFVEGSAHYTRLGNGAEELYDMALDPAEQQNLISSPLYAETLTRFRKQIEQLHYDR